MARKPSPHTWRDIEMTTFMAWKESRALRRRPFTSEPQKNRNILAGVDPRLRQISFDKLAILRELHHRLLKPRKTRTKGQVIRNFLIEFNAGILSPPGGIRILRHAGRSSLYAWEKTYQRDKLAGLVPKYKTKLSKKDRATFRPLTKPIILKFPGQPKRYLKTFFQQRLRRRWQGPPLEQAIKLNIFYSMAIPKGIEMPIRMKILKHQISHTGKPTLNALDCFIMNCLNSVVFKDPSQIIQFHSQKDYAQWPQTRILIKPLPG